MLQALDGILTFYSWHYALRAEKLLGEGGFLVELVPAPREFTSNCGTALRFEHGRLDEALKLLASRRVQVEAAHRYTPGAEGEPASNEQRVSAPRRWLVGA